MIDQANPVAKKMKRQIPEIGSPNNGIQELKLP